ncbi:hypothetical protein TWF730_000400 [Orbilia blumenaviensis]|uniref:Uncharacterized protein n=1 Tax=Orbilia blumenaviensis TaxID=1796055 RepID=A0AAV9VLF2_9PEZI
MNRLSFNAGDEETASNAPIPPTTRTATDPPSYIKYTPGGRLEFLKDIEAYQAACLINKVMGGSMDDPAPAYDSHEFANANSQDIPDDKEVFRARFQAKLCQIQEYTQRRRKGTIIKAALSDKALLLLYGSILILVGGFMAVWIIVFHHIGFLVFLGVVVIAALIKFFVTGWRFYHKKKMVKAIDAALSKVDRFERLDDWAVKDIKSGIQHIIPRSYWVDAVAAIRTGQASQ